MKYLDFSWEKDAVLTEFSMLLSIPSSKNAASVQTLWMEATTVPLDAGTPNMNVQIESKSNFSIEGEKKKYKLHYSVFIYKQSVNYCHAKLAVQLLGSSELFV